MMDYLRPYTKGQKNAQYNRDFSLIRWCSFFRAWNRPGNSTVRYGIPLVPPFQVAPLLLPAVMLIKAHNTYPMAVMSFTCFTLFTLPQSPFGYHPQAARPFPTKTSQTLLRPTAKVSRLWSNHRSNKPRRALLSSNASRFPLRSAGRLYFFICFFCLLSSSLTSSLHCLFPAVTGMLKAAKMLRMQRACALTFYSNNYPVFHVSRLPTL